MIKCCFWRWSAWERPIWFFFSDRKSSLFWSSSHGTLCLPVSYLAAHGVEMLLALALGSGLRRNHTGQTNNRIHLDNKSRSFHDLVQQIYSIQLL